MGARLSYIFHSGKNSKLKYYIESFWSIRKPHWLKVWQYRHALCSLEKRLDKEYILERVNYYNQLAKDSFDKRTFAEKSLTLREQPIVHPKVYFLDSYRYAKSFPLSNRWCLLAGDVNYVPDVPSIVKTRPLGKDSRNSVLMKLDKVRHFLFVCDKKKWSEKKNVAIFRGLIGQEGQKGTFKRNRYEFVKRYFGDPMVDIGVLDKQCPEWYSRKMTIDEHLDYKFIMSLEGNDVASNLKWVMSSNSIAVMPKPTCESWFMEGKLIPNYHYIEIKSDYSDLKERLAYYIDHPEEAEAIIRHAHEYVDQFRDRKREHLIYYLVLKKYFDITNS